MDDAIVLARNVDCAKSNAAYAKITQLASLMDEDAEILGHSFYYTSPEIGDTRLLGLLDTLISVIGLHMPKMTLTQWLTLVSLVCRPGVIDPTSLCIMKSGVYYTEASKEDLKVFSELQPIHWLAIALVANRLHAADNDNCYGISGIISEYTGEPHECVYADGPTIDECWTLRSIQHEGSTYTGHWDFVDGTKAELKIASIDTEHFSLAGFKCEATRHLAPANTSMSFFLFPATLQAVEEYIDSKADNNLV
ncbi:hypothetical protein ACGYKD_16640 [Sulfitobacter sp. TB366]|uniref:hypothetical protein n=1 Tax=Sulfitobacter sp. TB366 TaxID=3368580 RepID=UPI0037465439